jgi:hypothetical protein
MPDRFSMKNLGASMDKEVREELDGLLALTGGMHQVLQDAMTILRHIDPDEFDRLLRTRRLLVQTIERGEPNNDPSLQLRAHRHARDLFERALERTSENPDLDD